MAFSQRIKRLFSMFLAVIIVLSAVVTVAPTVLAKDADLSISGKVYKLGEDDAYDYSSGKSSPAAPGKNTFGKLSITGDAKSVEDENGFPAYEVAAGNLAFAYSFDRKQLEKDEYEWGICEDSGKEIVDVSLGDKIRHGAIVVETSLDGKSWVVSSSLTDVFTEKSAVADGFYTTKDIQLQNGCYYRITVAYEQKIRTEDTVIAKKVTKKNYSYREVVEVYELYAVSSEVVGSTISYLDTPRKELGKKINTGKDNGFSGNEPIDKDDPHYGWELGTFVVNGYTRDTEDSKGNPVFLKNVGDKVVLWFHLNQDISALNKDTALSIAEDTNGYDRDNEIPQTDFRHGALIIRYTDSEDKVHDPVIYTDYLAANVGTDADTRVQLFEEGDYTVSLDYEIKNSPRQIKNVSVVPTYTDYKISFSFSIRNGNCMVFPFDIDSGNELANLAISEEGFMLDMARSRYLTIDVQRSTLKKSGDGKLVEDIRFNRPAKDGDKYTDDGIYTFTVKNLYTGESTTKVIYVGTDKYLRALAKTGYTLEQLNADIAKGAVVGETGSVVMPTPKPTPRPTSTPKPTSRPGFWG